MRMNELRTMNDLISREAAIAQIERRKPLLVGDKTVTVDAFIKFLKNRPAVDAEPVRHGKWICEIEPNAVTASGRTVLVFRCSCCNFTWANKAEVLNYFRHCPNCGAKMDAEVKE